MIDSTIVRAHQHAAGGQQNQAVGRSRGGFSTKIHVLADALGNPMKFILTGGKKSDFLQALSVIAGEKADAVLIEAMGAEAIIPPSRIVKHRESMLLSACSTK